MKYTLIDSVNRYEHTDLWTDWPIMQDLLDVKNISLCVIILQCVSVSLWLNINVCECVWMYLENLAHYQIFTITFGMHEDQHPAKQAVLPAQPYQHTILLQGCQPFLIFRNYPNFRILYYPKKSILMYYKAKNILMANCH